MRKSERRSRGACSYDRTVAGDPFAGRRTTVRIGIAYISRGGIMKKLLLIALPIALAGSPAMSATSYIVSGGATGAAPQQDVPEDVPVSISGGGNATGYAGTFSATATNVGGGYASAYANEGIGALETYNTYINDGGKGVGGDASAAVQYTIRVVGPTTGALIPVHVMMSAYAGSLDVPGPVGSYYPPVLADAEAEVTLGYAEGDVPVGDPQLPSVEAETVYDYRYFTSGAGYPAPDLLGNGDSFDGIVMIEANFDVAVDVFASAQAQFIGSAAFSESAGGSAYADPTFAIDDPAFADYTITGVPVGPAAAAAPEPATWAMMLLGFAGLGYAKYRKAKGDALLAA
jgi:PEP-CTERM motif